MLSIAVTGANGYIGRHVVTALCDMGACVYALDLCVEGGDPRARWMQVDVFDPSFAPAELFDEMPDVCLHLAWRNGFDHNAPTDAGVGRVAVMGSMHEVGYWEGAITEETPCKPLSAYGVAKDALRRALEIESGRKGFALQWLRGFYIYGDDAQSQSIFGKLLRAAQAGQKTFPFTTGKNKYDFTPVAELAHMIAAATMQDEVLGIINCCSGKPVSLAEQIEGFIRDNHLDIQLEYGAFPDRPYDSPGVWGDASKIQRILG